MKLTTTQQTTLLIRIKFLSFKLGQIPPFLILSGFVAVIFLFSLIYYYGLSGYEFYDSTNQYDFGSFNQEVNTILHDLRMDIVQAYEKNGEAKQLINGWRMDINRLEVHYLYTGNLPSEFSFQITIPINDGTEGNWDSWTFIATKIIVSTERSFISDEIVYLPFKFGESFAPPLEGLPGRIPTPGISFHYDLSNYQTGTLITLPMSFNLYNRIINIGSSYRGILPQVSGNYMRMLYFSTGVATSSVFGEIVPVSTRARLSVISETLIAIIFIGLFLNSLAYGIGEALRNAKRIDRGAVSSSKKPKRPKKD